MRTTTCPRILLPLAATLLGAGAGSPESAEAQAPARDACTLLPASALAGILDGEVEAQDIGRSETWSACGYFVKPIDPEFPDPSLEIQVTWKGGEALAKEEREGAGDKLQPVSGLGDGAWVSRYVGQLSLLLVGDVLVQFHMALMPGVSAQMHQRDLAALEKRFRLLAQEVLRRM